MASITASSGARIDPRLRARRVAVKRAQGRRRLRVLLVATTLTAVVVGSWIAVTSPLLDVDRVVVSGPAAVPAEAVRSAAGVDTGDPLLLLDVGAVERRVEAVPAVLDARVARDLPGGLRIAVVEREPVAWARRCDGTVVVLDATGRAIAAAAADAAPALPEVAGLPRLPDAAHSTEGARAAAGVLDDLPGELRARVAAIAFDGKVATLRLDDGTEVRLGAPRGVAAKGRTAVAVLAALGGAPVAYVDVRVPAAPVTG
jgi:cell division protein FtsQ